AAVEQNQLHHEEFRLFELGHVYEPLGEHDRTETTRLAGASYRLARAVELQDHFRSVKGALQDLARMTSGEDFDFRECDDADADMPVWMSRDAHVGIFLR